MNQPVQDLLTNLRN